MRKSGFISILQFDERTLTRARVKPGAAGVEMVAFDQERGHWPAANGGLETALLDFVARHKVAEDEVATILPRHLVTVRILNLPTHDPAEAAHMIRFSAEEHVPYPLDELVVQQAILRKEPGGESKVMAVFAHKDVLKTHLAPLRKAGIIPSRVFLSTACLANAVAAVKVPAEGPYAVINLGSTGIEVLVFLGNKLLFGRGVASEQDWAQRGADAGDADEEIAVEVRGSLSAFRRDSEDGEGANDIYLAADYPVAMSERVEALAAQTGKECASAYFADALIAGGATASLLTVGAALGAQGRGTLDINLLPPAESRERVVQGAKVLLLRAGYAAGAVAAALVLLFAQAYWQRYSYILELEEQLRAVEPDARGLGEKQEQLSILRQQMKRGNSPLHMLAVAAEAAPDKNANVVQFMYNINDGADFWGRAKSVDDVQRFAANLRKAAVESLAFFEHAHSVYEEQGNERGEPVLMYQVSVPIEVEGDEAAKKAAGDKPQADATAGGEADQ